jgi:hypothetical protein
METHHAVILSDRALNGEKGEGVEGSAVAPQRDLRLLANNSALPFLVVESL